MIDHIASLARLRLTDSERERLADELEAMREFASLCRGSDGDAPELEGGTQPLRADVARPGLERYELLKLAPVSDGRYVTVPRVVEGSE